MNSSTNKLLIINGSPVQGSSTQIISERITEGVVDNGWSSETVILNDLTITPCQACGSRDDDDICIYHDDLYPIYEKFNQCDAVVVASPVYFDTVSAQTKLFIDRCNCYRPMKKTPDGEFILEDKKWKKRRGIIVLVGGSRQKFDCALTVLKGFFVWTDVNFLDAICYGHDSWGAGAAGNDESILHTARNLGASL